MKAQSRSAEGSTGPFARPPGTRHGTRNGDGTQGGKPLPDFTEGFYRVHFAQSERDREEVLRLRFRVFNLELGEGLEDSYATGLDRDPFDAACHHLMVTDQRSGALIGTYRIQTSAMAQRSGLGFYTDQEFDLTSLPDEILAEAIELGRACIDEPNRNGLALFALWRGLAAYLLWSDTRYLFGCCSLTSQDMGEGRRMQRYLERERLMHPAQRVSPHTSFSCGEATARDDGPVKVPRLFGTYLRFGALVCGAPAIDREFKTIDFFVLLDTAGLSSRVRELFFSRLPGSEPA